MHHNIATCGINIGAELSLATGEKQIIKVSR